MKKDLIEVYKNVLPSDLCDDIINIFESNIDTARPGSIGEGRVDKNIKSSLDHNILKGKLCDENKYNKISKQIRKVLEEKVEEYFRKYEIYGIQVDPNDKDFSNQAIWKKYVIDHSGLHIKKYKPNEDFFNWHVDTSAGDVRNFCRTLVMMFYLNDVKEGGETMFSIQNKSVKPTKGTLVIFPANFTARHKGALPISGDKYILNSWLLQVIPPLEYEIDNNPEVYYLNY